MQRKTHNAFASLCVSYKAILTASAEARREDFFSFRLPRGRMAGRGNSVPVAMVGRVIPLVRHSLGEGGNSPNREGRNEMRRDKLFGNMFMRLSACALIAFACAGEVWGIGNTISKPRLNPAFVKWQHEQKNQRPQANKSSVTNVQKRATRLLASTPEADTDLLPLPEGLVPTMIDFSYLNSLNSMNFGSVSGALLPSHDPRPLTPVRHQDPKDADIKTCWAQASVGSIETWLLSNGHGKNQFSVRNVVNLSGWDTDNNFHTGGHHIRSSAYFCDGEALSGRRMIRIRTDMG